MYTTARDITTKFFTFIMIGLMGMLIANRCIFTHTHILENGSIVFHAHPYDKTNDAKPYKTHHHTNAELLFLDLINLLFPVVFMAFAFSLFYRNTRNSIRASSFLFPCLC